VLLTRLILAVMLVPVMTWVFFYALLEPPIRRAVLAVSDEIETFRFYWRKS